MNNARKGVIKRVTEDGYLEILCGNVWHCASIDKVVNPQGLRICEGLPVHVSFHFTKITSIRPLTRQGILTRVK